MVLPNNGTHFSSIRPIILSIHPTMQCDYNCTGCYLKKDIKDAVEKECDFFSQLVRVSKKVGIKEIAVSMNYTDSDKTEDKNWNYYNLFEKICLEENLKFSITGNYEFFEKYWNDIKLKNVNLISISINDFVTSNEKKIEKALEIIKNIKKEGIPTVNCNVLLSKKIVDYLLDGLANKILDISDSIYLMTSKPLTIDLKDVGVWYSKLSDKLEIDSKRILIDTCIKYAFGLTDRTCDKHKMIYVNPYGEIKRCSFDTYTLKILENAEQFEEIYEEMFPLSFEKKCSLMGM